MNIRRSIAGLAVTVTASARTDVGALFDTVAAEDVLPRVLHRHLFIPGVSATADVTGPWDTPGSTRTVHLSGGGRAREQVDAYERPHAFAYTVSGFSGAFGRLVDHAVGTWRFTGDGERSQFTWTYRFVPRARRGLLVAFVVRTAWAGYMRRAAVRCVRLAETSASPESPA